jgi:hypothetical protein
MRNLAFVRFKQPRLVANGRRETRKIAIGAFRNAKRPMDIDGKRGNLRDHGSAAFHGGAAGITALRLI